MKLSYVTIRRCLLLIIVISFSTLGSQLLSQSTNEIDLLKGSWEGDFMPGNGFLLSLHFTMENDIWRGKVHLFQGGQQLQDDPLSEIKFNDGMLEFLIADKNTAFKGTVDGVNNHLKGVFVFPDGTEHPVDLAKKEFSKESLYAEDCFSVSELLEDLLFLQQKMNAHPQLNLYTSQQEFERLFDHVKKNIRDGMPLEEFHQLIAPLVESLRCSHTGIRLPRYFQEKINDQKTLIPIDIHIEGEQVFIDGYGGVEAADLVGVELKAVNGLAAKDIISSLLSAIPSDGNNLTLKYHIINAKFPVVFQWYVDIRSSFEIEIIRLDGFPEKLMLEAIRMEDWSNYYDHKNEGKVKDFDFEIMDEYAVLRVEKFWFEAPSSYDAFLQSSFSELKTKGIKHLILDLRSNGGGDPYHAANLLSYLNTDPFVYFEYPKEKGVYGPLYESVEPKESVFDGNIYLLVDGGCLSTSGHFISLFHYHQLGTIIGEEPGASFYCNDASKLYSLPNTRIQLSMAHSTYVTAVKGFKKGDPVVPDYTVNYSHTDVINRLDLEMGIAIKLIESAE